MSGIENALLEAEAGQCAITAALVIALDEHGVLPKQRYRDVLWRLWLEMPESDAAGEAGAVIEQMLGLLAAHDEKRQLAGKRPGPPGDRRDTAVEKPLMPPTPRDGARWDNARLVRMFGRMTDRAVAVVERAMSLSGYTLDPVRK